MSQWEGRKSLGGHLGKILGLLKQIRDERVLERIAEAEKRKIETLLGLNNIRGEQCPKNGKV